MVELYRSSSVVAKFVRASRILHWIDESFDLREIVVLVRHPCAVVSSQLSYEQGTNEWRNTSAPSSPKTDFGGTLPDEILNRFHEVLSDIDTRIGTLAAIWALDTYCALHMHGGAPGLVITYEELVARPARALSRLFGALGEKVPGEACDRLGIPSSSAASDLLTEDAENQLSKWKERLGPEQQDAILTVADQLGCGFYGTDVEPEYEEIHSLGREA